MKFVRMFIILLLFTIYLWPQPAQANSPRKYSYFVAFELGFAITPHQFTDYYNMGYGFCGGVEYPVSPNWVFQGGLDLKFFNPAESMIADWWDDEGEYPGATNISVSDGKLTAGTLFGVTKGKLKSGDSKTIPYIKGGFGITISGSKVINIEWDSPYDDSRQGDEKGGLYDETNISIILGGGFETKIGQGRTSLFVDIGLHMILQEDHNPNVIPITVGLKF